MGITKKLTALILILILFQFTAISIMATDDITVYNETENNEIEHGEIENDESEDNELDESKAKDGEIIYGKKDIIVPGSINGFEINLTKEELIIPSTYTVTAYRVNRGNVTKISNEKNMSTFLEKTFKNLLRNKNKMELRLKVINSKSEELDMVFPEILPSLEQKPRLSVNYLLYADNTGATAGKWCLLGKDKNKSSELEIAASKGSSFKDRKIIGEKNYGKFPETGISVEPCDSEIKASDRNLYYFVRLAPQRLDDGTYRSASNAQLIKIFTERAAPKMPAVSNDKTKAFSLAKGNIVFGGGIDKLGAKPVAISSTPAKFEKGSTFLAEENVKINLGDYNDTVLIWQSATEKRPASDKIVYNIQQAQNLNKR